MADKSKKTVLERITWQVVLSGILEFEERLKKRDFSLGEHCTNIALSKFIGFKPQLTSRILGQLLKDGYIKDPDKINSNMRHDDKRFKIISLTETGRAHARLIKISGVVMPGRKKVMKSVEKAYTEIFGKKE